VPPIPWRRERLRLDEEPPVRTHAAEGEREDDEGRLPLSRRVWRSFTPSPSSPRRGPRPTLWWIDDEDTLEAVLVRLAAWRRGQQRERSEPERLRLVVTSRPSSAHALRAAAAGLRAEGADIAVVDASAGERAGLAGVA